MTIALTGSTGFVGRALSSELLRRKFSVAPIEIAREATDSVDIGCLSTDAECVKLLGNAKVLVHLAARVHVMQDKELDPLAAFRLVNVQGTLNLARQVATMGLKRFIFISSIGVNGQYTNSGDAFTEAHQVQVHNYYTQSKHEAEVGLRQIAIETGLEVVIIRPPLVYGPNAPGNFGELMRAVKLGWPLPLGAVHNKRSLVALDNLIDFIITCVSHPQAANQTFVVSDGKDLSTTELVRGMATAAGLNTNLFPLPVWALYAGASLLGKGDSVQRLCGNLQVDMSKARHLLGWVPPVTVEEGLRRAMAV